MQDYSTLPLFSLQPETREIPLTRGKFAIVDAADYEWLMQWKWRAYVGKNNWYVHRAEVIDGRQRTISMHRQILDAPSDMVVDHRDHNGLNNTRSNLRIATGQQNGHNKRVSRVNTSGYKGVSYCKRRDNWEAYIYLDNKRRYLGRYKTAEQAAHVYDAAATMLFGDFAWLNFSEESRNG